MALLDLDPLMAAPRPVVGLANDYPAGRRVPPHSHPRLQLIHAAAGVMTVTTDQGAWVVPPGHALWMPAGLTHAIACHGTLSMRTLYLQSNTGRRRWPQHCQVVVVSELARALILRTVSLPPDYDEAGPDGRLIAVLLDELAALAEAPLHLPMPQDRRLRTLTQALVEQADDRRGLEDWAREAATTTRTLARLFRQETGLSFREWRQRRRLLAALERLSSGTPVTTVALDVGYDSPSAFIAAFKRSFDVTPGRYATSREE